MKEPRNSIYKYIAKKIGDCSFMRYYERVGRDNIIYDIYVFREKKTGHIKEYWESQSDRRTHFIFWSEKR